MSFQQGLSGLNTSSRQLDTIGNNVANASTVGFKQSQAQFSDQYAVSLSGGGGAQIGMGSKVAAIAQQFTQGNITQTSNVMDTAISGGGFFRMLESSGGVLFSRNGQFQVDKNGYIVNNQGHQLTGYLPNTAGVIVPSEPLPIQISAADLLPNPSVNVTVGVNLDARSSVPINVASFSTLDPDSYNNSTSLTIYDSLGVNHVGSLYFQRQPITTIGNGSFAAAGSTMTLSGSTNGLAIGNTITLAGVPYTITAVTSGTTVTVTPPSAGAVAAAPATTNAGAPDWNVYLTVDGVSVPLAGTALTTLSFNLLGQLTTPIGPPVGEALSAFFTPSGASAQQLTFEFGQTSQYGGNFGVNTLTQDGFTSGRLTGFSTGSDGIILGRYSNGQSRALGQVLLANFTNPQGLQPMGNNEWAETSEAGAPLIGVPGSSSLGLLQSSAVEDSNVDLTAELVSMITAQRVYQANAQTIKTQDQVLQTLVNLR
jgi:flagellar hook protein FlgE